jgi:hypothetical protein
MAALAATATAVTGANEIDNLLPLLLIAGTLGYLGMCVIWPYRPCRVCRGYGRFVGPFHGIRLCPWCGGTRLKLRFGRRVINSYRRLHRHARRHRRDR